MNRREFVKGVGAVTAWLALGRPVLAQSETESYIDLASLKHQMTMDMDAKGGYIVPQSIADRIIARFEDHMPLVIERYIEIPMRTSTLKVSTSRELLDDMEVFY